MVVCMQYKEADKNVWDSFVVSCKTPLFLFKRNFMEYHADRFVDSSFLFYEDNKLVALLPATLNEGDTLISHGGMTYGGLLITDKERVATVVDVFEALSLEIKKRGISKLIYKAIPHIYHNVSSQEDLYCISNILKGEIFRRDFSSVIYLNKRKKLSKGRRWLIARAKKLRLSVSDSTDWSSFHELLSLTLEKYGVKPVHSIKELEYLYSLFSNNISLRAVIFENKMVAGALLFKFDNVVHTQYLASTGEARENGAIDFLIEDCIQSSQDEGYDYFSFGASSESAGKILNVGLAAQKESFGARGITLDFYEIKF